MIEATDEIVRGVNVTKYPRVGHWDFNNIMCSQKGAGTCIASQTQQSVTMAASEGDRIPTPPIADRNSDGGTVRKGVPERLDRAWQDEWHVGERDDPSIGVF
jgi:hypothetical protein